MFKNFKTKIGKSEKNGRGRGLEADGSALRKDPPPADMLQLLKEYDAIKSIHNFLNGTDFDRAFAFLEKYPESLQAEQLRQEMMEIQGQRLKGLSYESAIKILSKMPGHPGRDSIVRGIYALEKEYISHLECPVLTAILGFAPDHPHAETIAAAIVGKNFTSAYFFITENPEHPKSRVIIEAMFQEDPNIALLLLQDQMNHPHVDAILEGMYAISCYRVQTLTPKAILFVLDVAPDHPCSKELVSCLIDKNYIEAFVFARESSNSPNKELVRTSVIEKYPELAPLLQQEA